MKKRHDRGTLVEALLVRPPRLERAAGHVQHLGRLALGEPLGAQIALLCKQVGAFEASPTLGAIKIALVLLLEDCYHSSLLYRSPYHVRNGGLRMAR